MELRDFHKLRAGLQMNAPSAPGPAADDLAQRLRAVLHSSPLLHSVEVERTDDCDRQVIAMVGFVPDADEEVVARELRRLWESELRYSYWAAHGTLVADDQVELQAASRISERGHYVTVHVVAQRAEAPVEPKLPARPETAPVALPTQRRRARLGIFAR